MTTYILIGGYPHKANDGGKSFCEELVKGFEEPVKILDCLFARPREIWDKSFAQDKEFFTTHLPNKQIKISLANPDTFIEQMRETNAVYFRGGSTEQLVDFLRRHERLEQGLGGKTVAGSSAGANAIAKYYYGLDDCKIGEGLGLLPVKVIVHYRSDYNAPHINWDKAYSELKDYREDIPILALAEGGFQKTS